jgi:hypothetical protein
MFGEKLLVGDAVGSTGIAMLPQGSYWPPLALLVGLTLAVAVASPRLSSWMLAAQVALFLFIAVQPAHPSKWHALPPGLVLPHLLQVTMVLMALAALAGLAITWARFERWSR